MILVLTQPLCMYSGFYWLHHFLKFQANGSIFQASGKYCIRMPNKWNSSFDYFYAAIVAMGIYVPGMSKTSFSLLTMMSLG